MRRLKLMRAVCMLGLLALAAALEATDASAAPAPRRSSQLFADFLAGSRPHAAVWVSTQATTASYYDEIKTVEACLKGVALENCRTVDGDAQYYESSVACCETTKHKKGDGGLLGPEVIDVGTCETVLSLFDTPIMVSATTNKLGKFATTCTLNSAAHLCTGPLCEQMVLEAEGNVFNTSGVVSAVNPDASALLHDADCAPDQRQAGAKKGGGAPAKPVAAKPGSKPAGGAKKAAEQKKAGDAKKGKAAEAAASTAAAAAAGGRARARTGSYDDDGDDGGSGEYDGARHPIRSHDGYDGYGGYGGGDKEQQGSDKFYAGSALIYSGTMTVTSRKYNIHVQSGTFEHVAAFHVDEVVDAAGSANKYEVTPYVYTLKFVKQAAPADYDGADEYRAEGYTNAVTS